MLLHCHILPQMHNHQEDQGFHSQLQEYTRRPMQQTSSISIEFFGFYEIAPMACTCRTVFCPHWETALLSFTGRS